MSGALACTIGFERGNVSIDGGLAPAHHAAYDARLPLHAGQVAPRAPPRRRPAARPAPAARRLTPKSAERVYSVSSIAASTTKGADMGQAKWWGWGDEGVAFTHEDKPGLAPFLERHLGLDVRGTTSRRRSASTTSTSPSRRCRAAPARGARGRRRRALTSRPMRSIASSTPAARACATSSATAAATSAGSPTSSSVRPTRTRSPRSCARRSTPTPSSSRSAAARTSPAASRRPRTRSAHGRLGRHGPDGPGARDRRRRRGLARVQAGRLRPATSRSSSTRAAGRSATSPTASPTRRSAAGSRRARPGMQSDKYGDIADLTRARPRGHARRAARHPPGAARRRPARACARWCWAARAASGSSREATVHVHRMPEQRVILGYLFPDWPGAPRRDARDRRERGVAVGHARVRRERDAVLLRHQEGRRRRSTASSRRR